MTRCLNVLAVQRKSHVANVPFSRSVCARITEALDYLQAQKQIAWSSANECAVSEGILTNVDVVFFSKHISTESVQLAHLCKKKQIKIIYDIDDWMLGFPEYSGAHINEMHKSNFLTHLALADVVTVANHRIANIVSDYHTQLEYVPNGFWVDKYLHGTPSFSKDAIRIVFTNADNLKITHFKQGFIRVIYDILEKYPEVQFDYFGDTTKDLEILLPRINYLGSVAYDCHKYLLRDNHYSFGIVPLGCHDDPEAYVFNSCKNPFKYLEYGGLGIPAIFSHSPVYEDVVTHHANGLLIDNNEEAWRDAVELLISNHSLRERLAEAAWKDVVAHHHISASANRMYALMTS